MNNVIHTAYKVHKAQKKTSRNIPPKIVSWLLFYSKITKLTSSQQAISKHFIIFGTDHQNHI